MGLDNLKELKDHPLFERFSRAIERQKTMNSKDKENALREFGFISKICNIFNVPMIPSYNTPMFVSVYDWEKKPLKKALRIIERDIELGIIKGEDSIKTAKGLVKQVNRLINGKDITIKPEVLFMHYKDISFEYSSRVPDVLSTEEGYRNFCREYSIGVTPGINAVDALRRDSFKDMFRVVR